MSEVRVAQGSYRPDQSNANSLGSLSRTASFVLVDHVELVGGFAGVGAPDPDDRDVLAYPTVLTGDLAGNDQPGGVGSDENTHHVLRDGPGAGLAVIDGFTVTAGNAKSGPSLRASMRLAPAPAGPTERCISDSAVSSATSPTRVPRSSGHSRLCASNRPL
ncbi:MAG: hypothetical protein SGJ11_09570 [Phycisphaerae bacterium]|nr:hypothetical protein [Phycisphaerae bacterium]